MSKSIRNNRWCQFFYAVSGSPSFPLQHWFIIHLHILDHNHSSYDWHWKSLKSNCRPAFVRFFHWRWCDADDSKVCRAQPFPWQWEEQAKFTTNSRIGSKSLRESLNDENRKSIHTIQKKKTWPIVGGWFTLKTRTFYSRMLPSFNEKKNVSLLLTLGD